jgi:hypothetical protein
MKKISAMLIAFVMVFSFATCGISAESNKKTVPQNLATAGAAGQLMVGADKQELVLPDDFLPYNGFRGRNFSTVLDPLYTRCIALGNGKTTAVFVTIELGDVGGPELDGWIADIEKATGLPKDCVYIHAEHVHSAPYAGSNFREEVGDLEKSVQFADICGKAILTVIQNSLANMKPATMNYTTGQSDININRDYKHVGTEDNIKAAYIQWRNPDRYCDHTIQILKFDDLKGETIAYWTNYAIHSTVLFQVYKWDGLMAIGGDIAGRLSQYVEDRDAGSVCMFSMGAAADVMAKYVGVYNSIDAKGNVVKTSISSAEGTIEILQAQADELGEAVFTAIRSMDKASAVSEVTLVSSQKTIKLPGKKKWLEPPDSCPSGNGEYKYDLDSDPVDVVLGILKIGDFAVATADAELVTSIGLDIKKALKENGCSNTMVVTMTNGTIQYVSDNWGYENFAFEGTQSWVAPGAGKLIVDGLSDLLSGIFANK